MSTGGAAIKDHLCSAWKPTSPRVPRRTLEHGVICLVHLLVGEATTAKSIGNTTMKPTSVAVKVAVSRVGMNEAEARVDLAGS